MQRLQRIVPPPWKPQIECILVLEPLAQVAQRLQSLRTHVLSVCPSCATALADLQAGGSLDLQVQEA